MFFSSQSCARRVLLKFFDIIILPFYCCLFLLKGSLKVVAGVCEMAAGKAPPTATPTMPTEAEEDASEEFPVTFSAPPSTTMADVHRPQVRAGCVHVVIKLYSVETENCYIVN